MAKLIYSMIQSLDGYVEDAQGRIVGGAPDEELHAYVNELYASLGTYLYGRRIYDTMVFWETAHEQHELAPVLLDFARQWQATQKVVYSRTMTEPRSARTRIERAFDAEAVRRLKAASAQDLSVDGPELAAHALRAGLVDRIDMIVYPVVVGGGKRFFPEGLRLDLEQVEARRFDSGVVVLRHTVRG